MKSSFNAFGTGKAEYGQIHVPVWLGVVSPVPVGGTLDKAYAKPGFFLGAGAPVELANKIIKPFFAWKVVAFNAGDGTTVTTDSIILKAENIMPKAGDMIMKVGSSFTSTGKAAEVISVDLLTSGDNKGDYEVKVAHTATIDSVSAGDAISLSSATSAGSSKSLAVKPNGYLYNDIFFGDLEGDADEYTIAATGAVVMHHPEGILIDLTPSAEVKAQMATAVPYVYQVSM